MTSRLLALVVLAACHGAPPARAPISGDPPVQHGVTATSTDPRSPAAVGAGLVELGPFAMAPPAAWVSKPVTSSMRVADYVLPAPAGEEAELVIYYFGEAGAGSIDANLDRWFGQFVQPDGRATREVAKIEQLEIAGQKATVVSVTGHYHAAAMPGGDAMIDKDDQALLAAIVDSPSGPYFFKLAGARSTVDANAASFRAMLGSLKLR